MPKKRRKKSAVPNCLRRGSKYKIFKKKLLQVARACDAEAVFRLIPEMDLKTLFKFRPKAFDVFPIEGTKMSAREHRELRTFVTDVLKKQHFSFVDGCPEINYYDYFSLGDYLRIIITCYRDDGLHISSFSHVEELVEGFKPLLDRFASAQSPIYSLCIQAYSMASVLSEPDSDYVTFEMMLNKVTESSCDFQYGFIVEEIPSQMRHLTIQGKSRPAYRLGWPRLPRGFAWFTVTPQKLGVESVFKDLEIDVYIQSHAMRRLKERLTPLTLSTLGCFIDKSIEKWDVVKNFKGRSLLPLYIAETKLGYFVYEYVEGVVLLKTFLLLTNNGTPEGEKLNNLLHLQMEDRKYLHLDKLSHFVTSDIPDNDRLYAKFKEAGFAPLFSLGENLDFQDLDQNMHAALIANYIHSLDDEFTINLDEPTF